jgi:hypothetical protein
MTRHNSARRRVAATERAKLGICPTPRKIPYPSHQSAENALTKTWRNPRNGGQKLPIRAYECECKHWHLTSQPLHQGADAA